MKIGPEDADILIGKIVILTSSYRDFPERASAKLKCELVRLKTLEEETECSSEGNIIFVGSGTDTDGPSGPPPIDITDPPVVSPADPTDVWLLVTGADQDDKDAENQVHKIRNILEAVQPPIMDAPVELRLIRSWRRTVIVFDSKEDASTALERLRRKLPYGGYLRQQSKWCPDLGEHDDINKIPTKNCVTS